MSTRYCSPTLSPAELASMQAVSNSLCNLDCTIKRVTENGTPDGWNNGVGSPTVVGTTKALKKQPRPALLQAYADRIGNHTAWYMSFPMGADVQERDVLVINGEEFKAQAKLVGSYDTLLNFLVTEVL